MQLDDALSLIHSSHKAVLFVGAGFANQSKNLLGEPTPSSRQLSSRILDKLGMSSPGEVPLTFAVDQLREAYQPLDAFNFLREQLTVPDATLEQLQILSLPWQRIYTTNIDNIGSSHSRRTILDAIQDDTTANRGDFIYLHGCLSNSQSTNYYQHVKMGEQLYMAGSHSSSRYMALLQQDLHEADAVFVIGYSMGDPDLAHIFFNTPSLINKCFVYSGVTSKLDDHRISLIGTNTKRTSTEFLADASNATAIDRHQYSSFIETDFGGHDTKQVSQTARQNLLIYGRFDRNIARSSWTQSGSPAYVIAREISEVMASIKNASTVVVHSSLGNGKSLILEYARFLVAKGGTPSFIIEETSDLETLRAGLREIPAGSFVFFDGNIFFASEVQDIIYERNLVFCTTSRSTTLRVAAQALYSSKRSQIRVFDANSLTESELLTFHDLIDSMGFWPSNLSSQSREQRLHTLRSRYESSTCAIVLSIFENPSIKGQISSQWNSSSPSLRPVFDHFVVSSYMNMIDLDVPAYIINQFQSVDYRSISAVANDIISVNKYGISAFSNPIVGEFVFSQLVNKQEIIGAIVRFANFVDGHAAQRRHQWIVRRLLRYWNLSRLLNSKTLPEEVFDRASYIPSISSDPLFWIQYSISKMENGDYLSASRFVSTAYSRANDRGKNFDTYQIDTHAARLTIKKIIESGLYDGFAIDLNRAILSLKGVIERRPDDAYMFLLW
ncbi:hypothetical protein XM25_12153 [Devosia sp. H5989]|nr:hypothetical protein XM25_12153 [Devosia sp. H5989]